jgi:hypothetical protein
MNEERQKAAHAALRPRPPVLHSLPFAADVELLDLESAHEPAGHSDYFHGGIFVCTSKPMH